MVARVPHRLEPLRRLAALARDKGSANVMVSAAGISLIRLSRSVPLSS